MLHSVLEKNINNNHGLKGVLLSLLCTTINYFIKRYFLATKPSGLTYNMNKWNKFQATNYSSLNKDKFDYFNSVKC